MECSVSYPVTAEDWSRDGKYLLYQQGGIGTHSQIWALPLLGERKPFQVVPSGVFLSAFARFSPDGRWIAYHSDESGRREVYVVPFQTGGGKWQVSTAGGLNPRWSSDGKEIFYSSLDGMLMEVPVSAGGAGQLRLGTPQQLFRINTNSYDVAPGGQKFLVDLVSDQGTRPMTLVVNWTADLKK